MAMIQCYFDDSQSADRVWAIGGYGGHEIQWEDFEKEWETMLNKYGVPYFHMKEFGEPNGVYANGTPLKNIKKK